MGMTNLNIEFTSDLFKCVHPSDPAIDASQTNLQEYAETYNWDLLTFHNGSAPTVYYLRNLPLRLRLIMDETKAGPGNTLLSFFEACVVRIENLRKADGNGMLFEAMHPMPIGNGKTIKVISSEAMETYFGDLPNTVLDIARVAYARSFLDRGSKLACPVSPTLQKVIDARKAPANS